MYYKTFVKLGFTDSNLSPADYPLFGFNVNAEYPLGKITLPVRARTRSVDVEFLVVKLPSPYNLIMGRTWLHTMQVVPSTYHQLLRFLTEYGIEQICGSQKSAQACYLLAAKRPKELEVHSIEVPDRESLDDIVRIPSEKATEALHQVEIDENPNKFFMIDASLDNVERQELVAFLLGNTDVFAWSTYEMPEIDPSVVQHRLNVDPKCKPIVQRSRRSAAEHTLVVIEEVDRLLEAEAVREAAYPTWLSNTVVIKKKNRSWHQGRAFDWTPECQAALDGLKSYLRSVPLLATPAAGNPLILYLAVSDRAVNTVLLKEELGEL
ncbi:uncharacterized protein LOC114319618 [Camellia sinensis]|uniref:uncharacterized protein LOC114319618 n=1 Tax=Camellia sinensis TaxID=4442 RepID=UPI001036D592|nr:uncharacterized protein LOC114319618 [Camellia sinensis]